jgi:hypothetical protein
MHVWKTWVNRECRKEPTFFVPEESALLRALYNSSGGDSTTATICAMCRRAEYESLLSRGEERRLGSKKSHSNFPGLSIRPWSLTDGEARDTDRHRESQNRQDSSTAFSAQLPESSRHSALSDQRLRHRCIAPRSDRRAKVMRRISLETYAACEGSSFATSDHGSRRPPSVRRRCYVGCLVECSWAGCLLSHGSESISEQEPRLADLCVQHEHLHARNTSLAVHCEESHERAPH